MRNTTGPAATERYLLSVFFLMLSALLILRPLAAFWNRNDAYLFGWGVPVLSLYLLYERWRCRPEPVAPERSRAAAFTLAAVLGIWCLLLLITRLVVETEPESRPVLWMNISLLVGGTLAWFGLLGGKPWVKHFAFPVAFLLLSVPWIFRLEFLVVQSLMQGNATAVAGTLALLDVPARAAGNTILLADGQLGVDEACSGIRSLQATLMMSLFFGEFYRFSGRGRCLLVFLGAALALTGNYARMLFLAWRGAHDGIASVEKVHDSAGLLILLFTVVSLWVICLALRKPRDSAVLSNRSPALPGSPLALRWAAGLVLGTFIAEGATQAWYGWREETAPRLPGWMVTWPVAAPGFHRLAIPAVAHEQLHDDAASAAGWRDEAGRDWTGTWFHYRPQAADKIVFASHNPELCLPAAGWRETEDDGVFVQRVGKIPLRVHGYCFESPTETRYVFWIAYLDRGAAPYDEQARGLYGHSLAALAKMEFPFLADVWRGCRGGEAETLEVTVAGPAGRGDAEDAFHRVITQLIVPRTGASVAVRGS